MSLLPLKTLPCFTPEQKQRAHALLATRVAHMMGRKFEEGDWASVYCQAKGFPEARWSNLNIDVMCGHLGVEHKMLCYRSDASLAQAFGTTLMHPSATRSIRIPSTEGDPNQAMLEVLTQYAQLIAARRQKIAAQNTTGQPVDLRTGWLLWQESLRQFLYFEEPMHEPDPSLYKAEWIERPPQAGLRKPSKNLWIFEKHSGRKRYSITTSAGAKIQPYFDVPPPDDPHVYLFTVIGEHLFNGQVRVWLTPGTAKELKSFVGSLESEAVSAAILARASRNSGAALPAKSLEESSVSLLLQAEAYEALVHAFPGKSDEICVRTFLEAQ